MLATKEQIQEAYQKAPEYIQDFITSEELDEMFANIRKKFSLHLDEAGQLSIAINTVALEIANLDQFPSLIKEALPSMPEIKRNEILKEVNDRIFGELREWARLDKEGLLYEDEDEKEEGGKVGDAVELEATTPSSASSLDKLTTSTHTPPEKVSLPSEESNKRYPGIDPYREPPE
ncbi:hypothetical protein COU15_02815 [Candidatus Kaiserbacteria bacterium CG10_big_fil_rev_8_21_14_0_10_45_20]|uniref:Uncharacterized protein n=1 Tax=Candidatus Kaiserbacteria bacterium CG10_big_fil_rev_8_21_14_0_10_45_20 TaxID=1974607 RepID=A0A2H0UFE2_9BACT|nr:MAG: hypothetical protein COU15_02815 [Candidatus Kaiserbacteria bacterium CG10_big_fil_rev_8_21_14_0_10_45_20]